MSSLFDPGVLPIVAWAIFLIGAPAILLALFLLRELTGRRRRLRHRDFHALRGCLHAAAMSEGDPAADVAGASALSPDSLPEQGRPADVLASSPRLSSGVAVDGDLFGCSAPFDSVAADDHKSPAAYLTRNVADTPS